MKNMLILLALLLSSPALCQSSNTLWYTQPAQFFEESLVLGNGKAGASVFGGVESDKIFLNDATLWSGEPVNRYMNPEAYKNLPAIREALKNEDYRLADQLQRKLQGKFSEAYAPLGTLYIDFKTQGNAQHYYRGLNISDAVSNVRYEVNGVNYTREYFISHPDQVMVIRLTSDKKGALDFSVRFGSLLRYKIEVSDNQLHATGYAPVASKPNYLGESSDAVVFEEGRGTRFSSVVAIKNSDGSIEMTDSTIRLSGATEAVIFVSLATSFAGFDKNPVTEGVDQEAMAMEQLNNAIKKPYELLKKSHLADYHQFFDRVSLNLGKTTAPELATDVRLKRYAEGMEDKNLEILYFQYGRYLLISSSRTPGVPANLQGIWNPYLRPPWSSNYTLNINAEENYWLAENTNLSEMHQPMLSFIRNISETGKITAKTFFGIERGWTACHNSDIWAMSNPVGNFGNGDPVWANWYMGGAWLSTHLWEHYLFTQDRIWLKNEGYSLMRGAAEFCLNWLVEDKNGRLITSPSTSPENMYKNNAGYQGATLYGATGDLAMVRACLKQCIDASIILDTDTVLRKQMEDAVVRLHPFQVGKKGNLQEWYYDWEDADPQHRHQTHLFGLYPGHQITPYTTPVLADACRKTLEIKGDETTGWSKGWRINLWARLGDGNHAYKMIRELLKYVDPDGLRTNYTGGGGTYPNLLDAHPPFQIDGNFGGAAAYAEMLVQSNEQEIRLLPALPDPWDTGSVSGLCARGGFEISMEWEGGRLKTAEILSKSGNPCKVIYGSLSMTLTLSKGETMVINGSLQPVPPIVVTINQPKADIQPTMWGIFFEDINLAADGGLYAEMVKNRSFEFFQPLMGWKILKPDTTSGVLILNQQVTNPANPRFIRITIGEKDKPFGLSNAGFRGMGVKKDMQYHFSVMTRQLPGSSLKIRLELVDMGGNIIGQTMLLPESTAWKKYTSEFTASATDPKAKLNIWFEGNGSLDLDMISLFPDDTWMNRPGGLRKDLVQLLADLKPGFLRFPGGCIVEGRELANRYQWKKTIGNIEDRQMIVNRWNTEFKHRPAPDYFQSFGLGFFEYFLLAEDIGAEPLPILNCGMACQFNTAELVPMDQLDPYIQDALDLIEFANGPADSQWGKVRSHMGHPTPFNLKMIGVGNEQWGPQYIERYAVFARAIKEKYPEIKIVSGTGPSPDGRFFEYAASELKKLKAEIVDEHYYANPKWFLQQATRYDSYDRNSYKIFAGEYAAQSRYTTSPDNLNTWECALAEAAFMTGLERNADVVHLCSYAPLFAHIEGWQWSPDLIWFDNLRSFGTPNYYVQKMFSTNRGTHVLPMLSENQPLTGQNGLYASAAFDQQANDIILKLVNATDKFRTANVLLEGAKELASKGKIIVLKSDDLKMVNSLEQPALVSPVEKELTITGKTISQVLAPYSLTVIRIRQIQ